MPTPPRSGPRPWWSALGPVLAVLGLILVVALALAGLVVIAWFVVLAVGIGMWGSNK